MATITKLKDDPGETLLQVHQWINTNVVKEKQRVVFSPTTRKELNDLFCSKISNAEDAYKLAGRLFEQLQVCVDAMNKFSKKVSEQKNHSTAIESIKKELSSSIDQKFAELQDKIQCHNSSLVHQPKDASYADIIGKDSEQLILPAGSRQPKDNSEITVFHLPDRATESEVNPQEVFDKISQNFEDSNTQVDFMYLNKTKNKIVAGFPNKQERSKGQTANCQLTAKECTIRTSEKLLPKLTVHNLPAEFFKGIDLTNSETRGKQKDRITEQIKKRNPEIAALADQGHTLVVVYLQAVRFGRFYTVALKVSPSIRRYLLEKQGGRLFIGNQCFPFEDRFYLRVCYHCQQYGHLSDECPKKTEDPICLYCSQRHASKNCPFKHDRSKYSCHRCSESPNKDIASAAQGHTANDPTCPVTLTEIKRLQSKTDFISKNVM